MSNATYRRIVKALHPDNAEPTRAQLDDACQAFNAWQNDIKKRRR